MVQFRLILLGLIFLSFSQAPNPGAAKRIVENMFVSIDNVKSLRFKLKKQERVNGEMRLGEQDVKFNRSPKKVYTYVHSPNKGVEVLFLSF